MEPNKVLVFVYNIASDRFLAVRNNPSDPRHGGDFWFTITGTIEKGENPEQTVIRELKEETALNTGEVFDLNWCSLYSWEDMECRERNFIAFVEEENIVLNHENIEFKWLGLKDFIEKIAWRSNKNTLERVLEKAIQKEAIFSELTIENFINQQ